MIVVLLSEVDLELINVVDLPVELFEKSGLVHLSGLMSP